MIEGAATLARRIRARELSARQAVDASLSAIDKRRASHLDGLHKIGQLPGVADMRDCRRVAGAPRCADFLANVEIVIDVWQRMRVE